MPPKEEIITYSAEETKELGKNFSQKIIFVPTFSSKNKNSASAIIICLEGELGSGKTTFAQGLLEGLGVEGPYTSPTFLIMKKYQGEILLKSKFQTLNKLKTLSVRRGKQMKFKVNIYHFDAYRVEANDILDLGWEEIIADKNNIVIVEWPERIRKIIPAKTQKIKFEGISEKKRKIIFM